MTSLPSPSAGQLAVHLRRLNEDGRLACIVRGPGGRLCGLANLRNLKYAIAIVVGMATAE